MFSKNLFDSESFACSVLFNTLNESKLFLGSLRAPTRYLEIVILTEHIRNINYNNIT
jgi:hypothetical protein